MIRFFIAAFTSIFLLFGDTANAKDHHGMIVHHNIFHPGKIETTYKGNTLLKKSWFCKKVLMHLKYSQVLLTWFAGEDSKGRPAGRATASLRFYIRDITLHPEKGGRYPVFAANLKNWINPGKISKGYRLSALRFQVPGKMTLIFSSRHEKYQCLLKSLGK